MIKKCDHPGCTRAGTCRAPKTRELKEFWYFCREHAAEYNKNWNYYAGMTPAQIEAEWERETFGAATSDAGANNGEYAAFINDFLSGRASIPKRRPITPTPVNNALKTFELAPTATWRDVSARYRALAKKYHPDAGADGDTMRFAAISAAYDTLKKYFKK